MTYKLIIFDLDGTLINTIDDLGTAVNHALSLRGWPLHDMQAYKAMVGHGVRQLLINAMPEPYCYNTAQIDAALADFTAYYTAHIDVMTLPYDGMCQLLEDLQREGAVLAVASNKFQAGTETLVSKFFPQVGFCKVCGNMEGMPLKPDAALVESIIAAAGGELERSEIVMVGDSSTDMQTAANAGIDSIAVSWGFRPASSLKGAGRVVDDVQQLREALGLPA